MHMYQFATRGNYAPTQTKSYGLEEAQKGTLHKLLGRQNHNTLYTHMYLVHVTVGEPSMRFDVQLMQANSPASCKGVACRLPV